MGDPQLFPLETVDVVVAGKSVWVFDATNKKLWEAKLNSELMAGFRPNLSGETPPFGEGPVIERGNTLYLFDREELTAFDLTTGNARWNLSSRNISGLHFDDQGMIYVNSTSEAYWVLLSLRHFDVTEKNIQMVQKVDPKTGSVIWKADGEGLVRYVSGQFLYTVASQKGDAEDDDIASMPVINTGFQQIPHIRIKRLDPATGQVLWEVYHGHTPLDVRFEKNVIAVVCKKEFRVWKYFTF